MTPDGRIEGDTQTAYILALAADVLEPAQREEAARRLVELIAERDHHLSTGFVGTRDILHVLSAIGRHDVAYRLLHNDTFPSWGFTLRHGATTIWERWDGWTPDKGFQDPSMNSFSHYAFGAVYQWMVENIGGVWNETPGYRRIRIAPVLDPWLEWARLRYHGPTGLIVSAWRRTPEGGARFEVEVPASVAATILLPAAAGAEGVRESGRPLEQAEGVRLTRAEAGSVTVETGSGRYVFDVPRVVVPPKIEREPPVALRIGVSKARRTHDPSSPPRTRAQWQTPEPRHALLRLRGAGTQKGRPAQNAWQEISAGVARTAPSA